MARPRTAGSGMKKSNSRRQFLPDDVAYIEPDYYGITDDLYLSRPVVDRGQDIKRKMFQRWIAKYMGNDNSEKWVKTNHTLGELVNGLTEGHLFRVLLCRHGAVKLKMKYIVDFLVDEGALTRLFADQAFDTSMKLKEMDVLLARLLWHYCVRVPLQLKHGENTETSLMEWVRGNITPSSITFLGWHNFDGMVLGALINDLAQGELCSNVLKWDPEANVRNMTEAMDTAERHFTNITRLVDPVDMCYTYIPHICVVGYVSQFITAKRETNVGSDLFSSRRFIQRRSKNERAFPPVGRTQRSLPSPSPSLEPVPEYGTEPPPLPERKKILSVSGSYVSMQSVDLLDYEYVESYPNDEGEGDETKVKRPMSSVSIPPPAYKASAPPDRRSICTDAQDKAMKKNEYGATVTPGVKESFVLPPGTSPRYPQVPSEDNRIYDNVTSVLSLEREFPTYADAFKKVQTYDKKTLIERFERDADVQRIPSQGLLEGHKFYDVIVVRYRDKSGISQRMIAKHLTVSATDHGVERFLHDAAISGSVKHENLLTMQSLLSLDGRLCMIMPAMDESLQIYLAREGRSLGRKSLIWLVLQAARALEYLHHYQSYVIQRLTTSTTMINHEDGRSTLKISDFSYVATIESASETTAEHDIYDWMPPERFSGKKHLAKSDTWTMAVFYCGVMSLGTVPPQDLSDTYAMHSDLTKGTRPPKPEICSEEEYTFMNDCWNETPKNRPKFGKVVERLETLHSNADDITYVDLDRVLDEKKKLDGDIG